MALNWKSFNYFFVLYYLNLYIINGQKSAKASTMFYYGFMCYDFVNQLRILIYCFGGGGYNIFDGKNLNSPFASRQPKSFNIGRFLIWAFFCLKLEPTKSQSPNYNTKSPSAPRSTPLIYTLNIILELRFETFDTPLSCSPK